MVSTFKPNQSLNSSNKFLKSDCSCHHSFRLLSSQIFINRIIITLMAFLMLSIIVQHLFVDLTQAMPAKKFVHDFDQNKMYNYRATHPADFDQDDFSDEPEDQGKEQKHDKIGHQSLMDNTDKYVTQESNDDYGDEVMNYNGDYSDESVKEYKHDKSELDDDEQDENKLEDQNYYESEPKAIGDSDADSGSGISKAGFISIFLSIGFVIALVLGGIFLYKSGNTNEMIDKATESTGKALTNVSNSISSGATTFTESVKSTAKTAIGK